MAGPDPAPAPADLAERRAARADVAERLTVTEAERDELRARVARLEGEVRELRQREESERRVRKETQVEAAVAQRAVREELEAAQRALRAAEDRAAELAAELERARAEAERAGAERERLASELAGTREGVVAERAVLHAEVARVREELAEASASRRELEDAREALAQAAADRDAAVAALAAAEARAEARDEEVVVLRDERDALAAAEADRAVLAAERDLLAARVEELVAQVAAPAPAEEPRSFAVVDPAAAGALRRKLDGLAGPAAAAPSTVAADLAAAAARLRGATPGAQEAPAPLVVSARNLRAAVDALAAADVEAAARLVLDLLPLQAARVRGELEYDLRVEGADAVRVHAAPGDVRTEPLPEGAPAARVVVSGSPAAVAPLVLGGVQRDLFATVTGRRRRLRARVLRGLARPVTLSEMAVSGAMPDPAVLLRALAAAVDPAWVRRPLAVVVDAGERWRLELEPGRGMSVVPAGEAEAEATIAVAPFALAAALAGTSSPLGAKPKVSGSQTAVTELLAVLARVTG